MNRYDLEDEILPIKEIWRMTAISRGVTEYCPATATKSRHACL